MELLRYHGGKLRSKHLLSYFPIEPITRYLEPFCGAAGTCCRLDTCVKRWLNDKDRVLIDLYREARDHPRRFKRRILEMAKKIRRADDLFDEFLPARVEYKFFDDPYAYFMLNRASFGCYTSQQRSNSATLSWNLLRNGLAPFTAQRVDSIVHRFKGVKLTAWHWKKAVQQSSTDTFCYYDPPWHCNSQIYGHQLTIDDHEELAQFLSREKRQWLLSIGYSELSIRLYRRKSWCHCNVRAYTKTATPQQVGQPGQELIVRNYD